MIVKLIKTDIYLSIYQGVMTPLSFARLVPRFARLVLGCRGI
jgi:hypothetical protein